MATLKQIARAAGVNVSIVSRVLNKGETRYASPATRKQIFRVAKELGYTPNIVARSLVRSSTRLVGIVLPNYLEPAYMRYQESLDRALAREELLAVPFFTHWDSKREATAIRLAEQKMLDGLIALHTDHSDIEGLGRLAGRGIPVVLRATGDTAVETFDTVVVDVAAGAYALTAHLLAAGYRRVALLGGFAAAEISHRQPVRSFAANYLRALGEFGIERKNALAIPCKDDGSDAEERIGEYLDAGEGSPDAVLCQSNVKLPGLFRALRARGLRPGADVGVASVTDSIYCHIGEAEVTVWEQPVEEICAGLVELFVRRLKNRAAAPARLTFRSALIPRASTRREAEAGGR